jgi:hypothetical protein
MATTEFDVEKVRRDLERAERSERGRLRAIADAEEFANRIEQEIAESDERTERALEPLRKAKLVR